MAKILLVDDEEPVLRTVGMLFRSEGHEVIPVRESEQAAEILKSSPEKFDVLLTDIRMAPIDGMEIIRLARKVRPDMSIVVISAYCSEKTIKQAMELGCTTYVKKPFRTEEVLNAVRNALEKSGSGTSGQRAG